MKSYDIIIVWAGCAWLAAGMYASRYALKNLIIGVPQNSALAQTHEVENYPWFIRIGGRELVESLENHAKHFGSEIVPGRVKKIELYERMFRVVLENGDVYESRYVLVATGTKYKKLHVPWEDTFFGRGVSYCATCDGNFFKWKDVAVIGGGDSAFTEALYLSHICKNVYLIHRSSTFRAETIWVQKAKETKNIHFFLCEETKEIKGSTHVESILLHSWRIVAVSWVFIAIGRSPNTAPIDHLWVQKDSYWYVVVDEKQETSIPRLYAAWDITTNSYKFQQAITAISEGCIAVHAIHENILKETH